jgi:hypothetical protein
MRTYNLYLNIGMFSIVSSAKCCVLRGTEALYVVYAFYLFLFHDLLHHSHTHTHIHDVPPQTHTTFSHTPAQTRASKVTDRQTNRHTDRRTNMLTYPPETCMRLSACTWVVKLITRCGFVPTPHVPISMVPTHSLPYPLLSSSRQHSHLSILFLRSPTISLFYSAYARTVQYISCASRMSVLCLIPYNPILQH